MISSAPPLLEVNNLSISFSRYAASFEKNMLCAVSNLSLTVNQGEFVAIVGASGSGKSLLAHAILGLLPPNAAVSGTIRFDGKLLSQKDIARLRGREIALVPQSVSFLDPTMQAGKFVRAADQSPHGKQAAASLFHTLNLNGCENLYPHELSGGMARRVLLATALMGDARLIIADEPTAGLDAAQAKKALSSLRELTKGKRSVLLITHDLDLAIQVADKIGVFYNGLVLEQTQSSCFAHDGAALCHPYTKALWRALPQNQFSFPAMQKSAVSDPAPHCPFFSYCDKRWDICSTCLPPEKATKTGFVRCFHDA